MTPGGAEALVLGLPVFASLRAIYIPGVMKLSINLLSITVPSPREWKLRGGSPLGLLALSSARMVVNILMLFHCLISCLA